MVKTIQFDPTSGKLYATFESTGLIIASYAIRLFSTAVSAQKILQTEYGNNRQPHDDTFWLRNKSNESESVASNNGRFTELITNIHTDKKDQGYKIKMIITQGDANTVLGSVEYSGTISDDSGGQTRNLGVIFKI